MQYSYSAKNIPKSIPPSSIQELLLHVKDLQTNKKGEYDEMIEVLRVPFDNSIEKKVKEVAREVYTSSLKYIFVVGIGGSSLGSRAIYDALSISNDYLPIFFLESLNNRTLKDLKKIIKGLNSSDEFIINVISKAGATTETVANFSILFELLSTFGEIKDRVVVTTTKESDLFELATKEGYHILNIPKLVSGRFSVFTSVGLFPLLLSGVPIGELLLGARSEGEAIGTPNDPSRRFAEDIYAAMSNNAHMLDFFFFNPELENLGKWARQLYAESLGKSLSLSGKEVHTGITPTVSIGSEDLHSMLQLYFAGKRDRLTLLIPPISISKQEIPSHPFTKLVQGLEGKDISDVNRAIYTGVSTAFNENKLMHIEAQFKSITPEMIGTFMQWQMQTVASIAAALNICTFDQPNIEDYKKVTRLLLSSN